MPQSHNSRIVFEYKFRHIHLDLADLAVNSWTPNGQKKPRMWWDVRGEITETGGRDRK